MPNTAPLTALQHPAAEPGAQAFLIGQTAAGLWIIRDASGLRAGLFRSREAAVRYVRHECADRNVAIAPLPDGADLEFPPRLGRAA